MKKLSDFKDFQSLCRERIILQRNNINSTREYELNNLINYIFSQKETNEYWIHHIIEYLNFNEENYNIKEPILINKGKKENTSSLLILSNDLEVPTLTSEDILNMRLGFSIPNYIIYDYEIDPNEDLQDYYNKLRTLREVLQSIGLPCSAKFFLSEEIMSKLKMKEQKSDKRKKLKLIKKNSEA